MQRTAHSGLHTSNVLRCSLCLCTQTPPLLLQLGVMPHTAYAYADKRCSGAHTNPPAAHCGTSRGPSTHMLRCNTRCTPPGRQAQGQSLPRRVTNKAHAEPQFCSGSSSSHARAATAADKYKASAEACRVPGVQQGTSHRSSAATAATSVPGSHRRTCCFQPCVLLMHSTRAATAAASTRALQKLAARRVSNKAHSL